MTRKQAIAVIEADAAENGQLTQTGIRAYIENRISYQVMQEAVERARKFGQFCRNRGRSRSPIAHVRMQLSLNLMRKSRSLTETTFIERRFYR